MYRICFDGVTVYRSADPARDPAQRALDPVLSMRLNRAPGLVFTLPPGFASPPSPFQTAVTVYRGEERIFYGRAIGIESDVRRCLRVTCEGELAFLRDSVVRPYRFERRALTTDEARRAALEEYFSMLLASHNAQTAPERRFLPGRVDPLLTDLSLVRESGIYPDTLAELENKLLSPLGGCLCVRYETENGQERRYLDYLAAPAVSGEETQVRLGENLLSLEEKADHTGLFTVLVPLGDEIPRADGDMTPVTLADDPTLTDGADAIENAALIARYGRVSAVRRFPGVTRPATLFARAQAYLAAAAGPLNVLTVRAALPEAAGVGVGSRVRVISAPHALDASLLCESATLYLSRPERSVYTFGGAAPRLTERLVTKARAQEIYDSAAGALSRARRTTEELRQALAGLPTEYVTNDAFTAYQEEVAAAIEALRQQQEE